MKRVIIILAGVVVALIVWNKFSTKDSATVEASQQSALSTNSIAERIAWDRAQRGVQPEETSTNFNSEADEYEERNLSDEQIEAYLLKSKRSPESLLNAFWESGDTNFLAEAVEKHSDNPMVQWEMVYRASKEERGLWLEKLKVSSPDNALPNYLSALDNLKAGNTEKALAEMDSASQKNYSDFERERTQSREEMYLFSGFSPIEAQEASLSAVVFPNLPEMKQLALQLHELQKNYIAAGDPDSAQLLAMLGVGAGRKMCQANAPLIHKLVGNAMENIVLANLSAENTYDFLGKTPAQRQQEMKDQRQEVTALLSVQSAVYPRLSDSEKLIYFNRYKLYGELEAMRWLKRTYGETK